MSLTAANMKIFAPTASQLARRTRRFSAVVLPGMLLRVNEGPVVGNPRDLVFLPSPPRFGVAPRMPCAASTICPLFLSAIANIHLVLRPAVASDAVVKAAAFRRILSVLVCTASEKPQEFLWTMITNYMGMDTCYNLPVVQGETMEHDVPNSSLCYIEMRIFRECFGMFTAC